MAFPVAAVAACIRSCFGCVAIDFAGFARENSKSQRASCAAKKTMKNGGVASGSSGGSRFCSLEQCVLLSDLLLFPPTLTSLVPVGRWFHIVCRCVFISFDFSVFWLCLCQLSLPDVYISLLCGLWRVVRGASPSSRPTCKSLFQASKRNMSHFVTAFWQQLSGKQSKTPEKFD